MPEPIITLSPLAPTRYDLSTPDDSTSPVLDRITTPSPSPSIEPTPIDISTPVKPIEPISTQPDPTPIATSYSADDYQTMRALVQDPTSFGQSRAVAEEIRHTFPSQQKRDQFINTQFLSHRLNASPDQIRLNYPAARDTYARTYFGLEEIDDTTFRKRVAQSLDLEDQAMQHAQNAAFQGLSPIESWEDWKSENGTTLTAAQLGELQQNYEHISRGTTTRFSPYLKIADSVIHDLRIKTGLEEAPISPDQNHRPQRHQSRDIPTWDDIITKILRTVPKEDQDLVLSGIVARIPEGETKDGILGSIQKVSENISRTFTDMSHEIVDGIQSEVLGWTKSSLESGNDWWMRPWASREKLDDPNFKKEKLDLIRFYQDGIELSAKVRSLAFDNVDPVKGEWLVTQGIYDATRSLPRMALSVASPAGFVLSSVSHSHNAYIELRETNPDMTREQADAISDVVGPVNALIERVSTKAVFGRLPAVNRLTSSLIGTGRAAAFRYGVKLTGGLGSEIIEENLQNLTPTLMQEIFAAFDEDIPHANIRERWSETANWETQSRIFFATLPITLIGSGVSTYTEFSESSQLFTEPLYLQATGLTETDATAVSDAWNAGHRDTAQSLLRSAYQTADIDQSHVARIRQQADAKLQLAAIALRDRTTSLERSRQLPTLHSISDSQHQIRLPDGKTIDYPTREEADAARWQWAKDNGIDIDASSQELSDIKDRLAWLNDAADGETTAEPSPTEQAPVAPPLNLEYLHEDEPRSQRESPTPGQTAETLRHVAGRSDGTNDGERRTAESPLYQAFAEAGLILDPGKLNDRLPELKKLAGRNEHTVYLDPASDRVIKLTNPNEAGAADSAYEYFAQRQQSNDRFDDDMRVEGIVDFGDGWQIVTSQPFIRGRNTTANERAEYFNQMGFEPIRDDAYYNPSTETIITDADGTNVLIDQDGEVFPIDVYVSPVESFHQQNLYEEQLERTRAERREREAFEAQINGGTSSDDKLTNPAPVQDSDDAPFSDAPDSEFESSTPDSSPPDLTDDAFTNAPNTLNFTIHEQRRSQRSGPLGIKPQGHVAGGIESDIFEFQEAFPDASGWHKNLDLSQLETRFGVRFGFFHSEIEAKTDAIVITGENGNSHSILFNSQSDVAIGTLIAHEIIHLAQVEGGSKIENLQVEVVGLLTQQELDAIGSELAKGYEQDQIVREILPHFSETALTGHDELGVELSNRKQINELIRTFYADLTSPENPNPASSSQNTDQADTDSDFNDSHSPDLEEFGENQDDRSTQPSPPPANSIAEVVGRIEKYLAEAGPPPETIDQHPVRTLAARKRRQREILALIGLPKEHQGKIARTKNLITGEKRLDLVDQGIAIIERFVSPKLLPHGFTIKDGKENRSNADPKTWTIYIKRKLFNITGPRSVAHEIVHLIEFDNPQVLRASVDFALERAKGETPKRLIEINAKGKYKNYEIAYEDEWVRRGSSEYVGKIYLRDVTKREMEELDLTNLSLDKVHAEGEIEALKERIDATEVLTVGIERLLDNSEDFVRRDPDYFKFVVGTLQGMK